MTERQKTDWITPQTILAAVGMLAAFGSFWLSFDRRVTINEANLHTLDVAFRDHRDDEKGDLRDIKASITELSKQLQERRGR